MAKDKEKEQKVAQSQGNEKKTKPSAVATRPAAESTRSSCTTSLGVTYIRGNAFVF